MPTPQKVVVCPHPGGGCDEIKHLKELLITEMKARDLAQQKFEAVVAVKMDHLNDIRPQLAAQKGEFLSRTEYDLNHKLIENKIDALQRFMWIAIGALAAVEFILKYVH